MPRRNSPLWAAVILLLTGLLALCAGCSPYTRYRVLSFFLDGVPHPDDALNAERVLPEGSGGDARPQKTVIYRHPASSAENECSLCHGDVSVGNMVAPTRDICVKCHTHIREGLQFIHGPAAIDCVACHDVHESRFRTLVRQTGNPLCLQCHYQNGNDRALQAEAHQGLDSREFNCLDCHYSHGGHDRFFLRPDAAERVQSARRAGDNRTRPADEPAGDVRRPDAGAEAGEGPGAPGAGGAQDGILREEDIPE